MNKTIKCFECLLFGVKFDTSLFEKQKIKCNFCGAPYNVKAFKNGRNSIRRADRKDYREEFYGVRKRGECEYKRVHTENTRGTEERSG